MRVCDWYSGKLGVLYSLEISENVKPYYDQPCYSWLR